MTTENINDQTPLQQAEVHFTGQSPLQQAEAYFTECVIIASETPSDLDRELKFEQAKMTAIKLLNYNIDYWLQTRAEFEQIITITEDKKIPNDRAK
jgi:ribosomal protein L30E